MATRRRKTPSRHFLAPLQRRHPLTRAPGAHAPSPATLPPHATPHLAQTPTSASTPDRRSDPSSRDWVPPEIFFSIYSCNATPQLQIRLPLGSPLSYDGPRQNRPSRIRERGKTQESAGNRRGGGAAVVGGSGADGRCLQRCGSLVAHTGFEPVVSALRGRCPWPLDECATPVRPNWSSITHPRAPCQHSIAPWPHC